MKKFWNEWKWWGLALVGILLLGFFFRIYNLTNLPVFADEAIYIRWAQVMKSESTLRFLPLSDGKQPLSMWLMIPFLKFISDPLVAGRMLSVFTGLGTILGVFVASYLLFKNKKVSLLASLAYSIVPFSVFFDRMALADSTLTMFGVWVLGLGILLAQSMRLDVAMILGFVLGGALLTKSPALYFSLLLPTLVVLVKNKKDIFRYLILLVPTYLIGYGMYNILRLGPNFQLLAQRNLDYVYPLSHLLTSAFDPFKPFLDRSRQFYWIMGTAGLFFIWLLGYLENYKKRIKETLVLTAWFLGPILISSEFSKTMTARYVLFSLPFFIIFAASVFLTKVKWLKIVGTILGVIFIIQAFIYDFKLLTNVESADLPRSERSGYLEEWTAGQGIRETALYLQKLSVQGDNTNIVVGTEGYFGTLPDGLQIYFDKSTNVNVIGIGLELDKVPMPLIDTKKAGNKVYLVANDERTSGDLEKLGLTKIQTFQKATRPDGSHQSLILYEVTEKVLSKNK